MTYKRGPGCPFRVILLWGPRGEEDISEVLLAAFFLSPALLFQYLEVVCWWRRGTLSWDITHFAHSDYLAFASGRYGLEGTTKISEDERFNNRK